MNLTSYLFFSFNKFRKDLIIIIKIMILSDILKVIRVYTFVLISGCKSRESFRKEGIKIYEMLSELLSVLNRNGLILVSIRKTNPKNTIRTTIFRSNPN